MPQFNVRSVIDYPLGFIVVLGIEGEVLEVRRLALDCGRLGREDVIGRKLWKTAWWSYDDEVAGKVKSAFDQACEGREVRFQTRALLKDNQLIDLDFMLSPFVLNERKLQFIVASAVDISVQKIEDSKNALLVAELTHRLRNLFGLVLGIADTTLVRCPPDVRQEFDNRIKTLIAAQDLFQLDSAQRIRFSDLLHSQVLSVVGVADDRILMTGPDFSLMLE